MAAITDVKSLIETQLSRLISSNKEILKNIWRRNDLPNAIQLIHETQKTLHELQQLCAKVEEQARPSIQSTIEKTSTKLNFGERLANYLLEKSTSVDPRVEKIFTKIKNKPLPSRMEEFASWQTKLSSWHKKLDQLSAEGPNAATASEAEKAKSLIKGNIAICEMRKEVLTDRPLPELEATLTKTEQGSWVTPKRPGISYYASTYAYTIDPISPTNMKPFLLSFARILGALAADSQVDFFHAVESVVSVQNNLDVNQTENEIKTILAGICDHLYCIQHKETPDKIDRKDRLWNTNALLSSKLSTSEQRMRAAQRFQVESLLKLLLLAFEREDNEQARELLEVLEKLILDPRDLPGEPKNIAHQLFGKLFCYHVDARKIDPSLENPYDHKFKRDFGRLAFTSLPNACPTSFKKAAIKEVLKDLNSFWAIGLHD